MTLCPIAMMVHCTGCPLVKFCPAKTILGDFGKETDKQEKKSDSESSASSADNTDT
ncbi:MAG: hypothetical protein K2X81_18200 [Candidatus Obscuribacterales bacterium]|nr:hypothetical protein [Candidatus Obscuribacterales bacterium]